VVFSRPTKAVAVLCVLLAPFVAGCAREQFHDPEWPPPDASVGEVRYQSGWATYYASRFAGRATANGERYDPRAMTAAHRTLPFGTMVKVERADGRSVVVRINDRGPYVGGRILDLSYRAADELGMVKLGKVWVELKVLVSSERPSMAAETRDAR
jgi:rare lipoprotein A